nr:glycoprotein [Walnut Creek virus]
MIAFVFLLSLGPCYSIHLTLSSKAFVRTLYNDSDHDNALVIPTKFLEPSWHAVTALDIQCPTEKQLMPEYRISTELGTVKHPHVIINDNVQGFYCHKQTWVSTCTETWYFSSTEETEIINQPITFPECEEAITLYLAGEEEKPFFPPFVCSWASTQRNDKTFIITTPHSVRVDIYTGAFRDPSFIGGKCDSKECLTINKDIVWIPRSADKRDDTCDKQKWETGPLYFSIETKEDDWTKVHYITIDESWVRSPFYGVRSLKGACRRQICRNPGIRFSNGEWWGIEYDKNMAWITKLRQCPKEKVTFHHDYHLGREMEESSVFHKLKCREVAGKILSKDKVTPYELSFLTPQNPGIGWAYRLFMTRIHAQLGIRSYRLEKRKAVYHKIHNVSKEIDVSGETVLLGRWYDNAPVYVNKSDIIGENTTRNEIFLTFNGLVKFGDKIYFPEGSVMNGKLIEEINSPGELVLEKQSFEKISVSNQVELLDHVYKFEFKKNSTNLIDKIVKTLTNAGKFIGSYFSKFSDLIWWVGGGCISLIITIILWKTGVISKFCFKRGPTNNADPVETELKPMSTHSSRPSSVLSDHVYASIPETTSRRNGSSSVFFHY